MYLNEELAKHRLTRVAITQDSIDTKMWSVANRCLQEERVEVPGHLKGRAFEACDDEACERCKHNLELLEDWQSFGGIYKFDANGSVKALLALGRDRGLYIDRKLVGRMEGDEIVDAMSDPEVRELVRSLCSQVGLRVVEVGGEGASGPPPEQGPKLRSVS